MGRAYHAPALRHVFGPTGHLRSRVHPVAVPGLLSLLVVFAFLISPRLATAQESAVAGEKTEFAVVPLVGGDSDVGFGGGALGSLTNLVPGLSPYRWRIEAGVIATFKPPEGGNGITAPYQDAYLLYTVPDLIYRKLRLEVRPSYTRETTQAYHGIGNGSPAVTTASHGELYGRLHPTLLARVRLSIGNHLSILVGNPLTYNEIDVPRDSQLAVDAHSSDPRVRQFFGPLGPHWVDFFEYAAIFDNRDNENVTENGMFHQVKLRLSPGKTDAFPYRYGQVNTTLRST